MTKLLELYKVDINESKLLDFEVIVRKKEHRVHFKLTKISPSGDFWITCQIQNWGRMRSYHETATRSGNIHEIRPETVARTSLGDCIDGLHHIWKNIYKKSFITCIEWATTIECAFNEKAANYAPPDFRAQGINVRPGIMYVPASPGLNDCRDCVHDYEYRKFIVCGYLDCHSRATSILRTSIGDNKYFCSNHLGVGVVGIFSRGLYITHLKEVKQ